MTAKELQIGQRVQLTEQGRSKGVNRANKHGVVVGYGWEDYLIRIRLDGNKSSGTWHIDFWEPES